MTCETCGEKPKKCGNCNKDFPKAVIEIDNPETLVLFRKVVIPVSMGDDTTVPPIIGKYHNVLLNYEANNHTYVYSSDGVPTLLTSDVGEMKELTSADYNYPSATPDGVALWALNDGVYESSSGVKVYAGNGAGQNYSDGGVYIISTVSSGKKNIQVFGSVATTDSSGRWAHRAFYRVGSSGSVPSVSNEFVTADIANDLQTTSSYKALSASQGKILNDKITPLTDNGAPDASTVGIIGKIYIDTNTDNAYMCTKVNNGVYTWKQITA